MAQVERLYNLIKDLFFMLDEGDQQFFGKYNLSITRYYTLYHLAHAPGMSLSDLSRVLLCDKSNVTRIIKSLEQDRLVERQPHETDKRSSRLFLTDSGRSLQQTIAADHRAYNQERFADATGDGLLHDLEQLKEKLLHNSAAA